jgi:hypothetical protein
MDEQFPILERLYIWSRTEGDTEGDTGLLFPLVLLRTFQAPHLRHLVLGPAALPIGSPLFTSAVGLVTLTLAEIPPSPHFPPSYLLTWLSLMPQLENLGIRFYSSLRDDDDEDEIQLLGQLDTPIMTHITLPNLRRFEFRGVSTNLEGLLDQISAPVLSHLEIVLLDGVAVAVPRLLQFLGTSTTLSFSAVRLAFHNNFADLLAFQLGERRASFRVQIMCSHLDWQVSFTIQILSALRPVPSVEQLTLSHVEHFQSPEWHIEVGRAQWRQLLRPFANLKTLHVQNDLVNKLARSLTTDDGEPPIELLPNLKEVGYSGGDNPRDVFTPFIDERQVAGYPVKLTMVDPSVFR